MNQSFQFSLKTTVFDRKRKLIINPEFIEFDNTSLTTDEPVRMLKFEITGFRYGIKSIRGYKFRIGRIYSIDVKSATGIIIKIRMKSIYQINRKKLEMKYRQILQALFENFINDISNNLIAEFNKNEKCSILGVTFMQEGILFEKENSLLTWVDVGTKDYWSYYSIFSLSNPAKYKVFEYLTDWNTVVLYTVSRHILKMKKI